MASDVDYMHNNISTGLVSGDIPDWGDDESPTYKRWSFDTLAEAKERQEQTSGSWIQGN